MYEGPIQDLIDELARLPGIGPKSAQRLAFHLVKAPDEEARRLADVLVAAKDRITLCSECGNVAEGELCRVCRDPGRDATVLCVVEEPKDAATIERAGIVKGRYHVLGGARCRWRGRTGRARLPAAARPHAPVQPRAPPKLPRGGGRISRRVSP